MKRKKILTVLLSVIMTASILAGCGERQETMGSAEGTRQEGNKESKETTDREKESATAKPKEDKKPEETAKPEESKKTKTVTLLTKETYFNNNGKLLTYGDKIWFEYEYDTAGNMTKKKIYVPHADPNGIEDDEYVSPEQFEYEYDTAGNMTKEKIKEISIYYTDNDKQANPKYKKNVREDESEFGYEYDAVGNMTKKIKYGKNGRIRPVYEYEYDAVGNMTKKIKYSENGGISEYDEYEYDAAGLMTKETNYYESDGKFNYYWVYEYAAGLMTKKTKYSQGGREEAYEYEYDAVSRMTKMIEYSFYFGELLESGREEYEYDTAGNMTKMIKYSSDGYISSGYEYEYEYDAVGNVTKEIAYFLYSDIIYEEKEYITITLE